MFARGGAAFLHRRLTSPSASGRTIRVHLWRYWNHDAEIRRRQRLYRWQRHCVAVRGGAAHSRRCLCGRQYSHPRGARRRGRCSGRIGRSGERVRHARRPHVDGRGICVPLECARDHPHAERSRAHREGRGLGIQRHLALQLARPPDRKRAHDSRCLRPRFQPARPARTDATPGNARRLHRDQAHRGLFLTALLRHAFLGHVANDVRVPELAQRHRAEAVHAALPPGISAHPHAGRRAAHGVEPVRLRRTPDGAMARESGRALRFRYEGHGHRLRRRLRRSRRRGDPRHARRRGHHLRRGQQALRLHHDRLNDRRFAQRGQRPRRGARPRQSGRRVDALGKHVPQDDRPWPAQHVQRQRRREQVVVLHVDDAHPRARAPHRGVYRQRARYRRRDDVHGLELADVGSRPTPAALRGPAR